MHRAGGPGAEAVDFRADMYDIPRRYTPDQLLADPEIEAVINLTNPAAHFEVSKAILEAGKHVYNEKPLATTREDAAKLLEIAAAKGLRVGCAPDTFLGAGIQTCLHLDQLRRDRRAGRRDGLHDEPRSRGQAIAAAARHPAAPAERHAEADRPLLHARHRPDVRHGAVLRDGSVGPDRPDSPRDRLDSDHLARAPARRSAVQSETPSHIAGIMDHESGAISTIITSSDIWPTELPRIEIYGETGSLSVPDPNFWGGPVRIRKAGEREWTEVPLTHAYDVEHPGHRPRRHGEVDPASAGRIGRVASSRTTCSTRCRASTTRRAMAGTSRSPASSRSHDPLPIGLADGELD